MTITQDIVEKFIQEQRNIGRTEGRAEGRTEGRAEGRTEGFQQSVLDLYANRFGPPPAEVEEAIRQVQDQAALRALFKVTLTGSAEEVLSEIRAHWPGRFTA